MSAVALLEKTQQNRQVGCYVACYNCQEYRKDQDLPIDVKYKYLSGIGVAASVSIYAETSGTSNKQRTNYSAHNTAF